MYINIGKISRKVNKPNLLIKATFRNYFLTISLSKSSHAYVLKKLLFYYCIY